MDTGTFFIDMTATQTNSTSIPYVSGTANLNATDLPGSVAALVILHAICLSGSFLILFPLGVSLLRFFNSFRFHWILQIIATVVCIIGLVVAIAFSVMDFEYNSFSAAHQIIGILVVVALIFQAVLGFMHHKNFKRVGGRTWMSYAHLWTGRAVIIVGMVNAVLYVISLIPITIRLPPRSFLLGKHTQHLLTIDTEASPLPNQRQVPLV